jgi:putative ATP-binding cassette transporter
LLESPSLRLLEREAAGQRLEFLLYALGAGIANSTVLAVINSSSGLVSSADARFRELAICIAALAVFVVCLRRLFSRTARVFEDVVHEIRLRLVSKIRRSNLRSLEGVGKSLIYNRLTLDTTTISQSQGMVTTAFQSGVMCLFIILYMALLSFPAFVISIALVSGGFYIHSRKQAEVLAAFRRTSATQVQYFGLVTSLLDGFKEVKIHRERGRDLAGDLESSSVLLRSLTLDTYDAYHSGYVFSQVFFYVLLACLVFVFPRVFAEGADVVTDLSATILFLVGPLTGVVSAVPAFTKINVAIDNIYALERQLDQRIADRDDLEEARPPMIVPERIVLHDVGFRYFDTEKQLLFTTGPLNAELRRGEIVFIVGGNGSGKSTMLKLLMGLYTPEQGYIAVDGQRLDQDNIGGYQALFSAIFSDFHLFKKLYGMLETDAVRVHEMLVKFNIAHKTSYSPPAFSRTDLSTGQRKRIALTVALLEDRPICVFDEVASDQDSDFRRYFYRTLLPELKAAGKTVIVVSHDDRYFDVADQLLKLELGQIQEVQRQGSPGILQQSRES